MEAIVLRITFPWMCISQQSGMHTWEHDGVKAVDDSAWRRVIDLELESKLEHDSTALQNRVWQEKTSQQQWQPEQQA